MLPNHLRLPVEMLAQTQITQPGVKVVDLPGGPINHHWTKNVIASQDGTRLHVTVGSNSNVGENGMEHEIHRAAILEIDPATGHSRVFASGLRNPMASPGNRRAARFGPLSTNAMKSVAIWCLTI